MKNFQYINFSFQFLILAFYYIPSNTTIKEYLLYYCDITSSISKNFIYILISYINDPLEKQNFLHLLEDDSKIKEIDIKNNFDSKNLYIKKNFIQNLNLLDLLSLYKSLKPPISSKFSLKKNYY